MTSVICHPDYPDVTMPCRSGARLTLDVTMSHISIKMRRVVTADPGVTCPLSISDVAPGLYQSPDTGDPSRDQEKGKGEKETQINCKIWPPPPPPPRRPLATYLQLAED